MNVYRRIIEKRHLLFQVFTIIQTNIYKATKSLEFMNECQNMNQTETVISKPNYLQQLIQSKIKISKK